MAEGTRGRPRLPDPPDGRFARGLHRAAADAAPAAATAVDEQSEHVADRPPERPAEGTREGAQARARASLDAFTEANGLEKDPPGGPAPRCSRRFAVSKSSGRAVPIWCGKRTCRPCAKRLYEGSKLAIAYGADHPPDGYATALLTITQDPRSRVGFDGFQKRWKSTRQGLRDREWITGFACVVEPHKSGVLHAHVTCWVPEWLADELDVDATKKRLRDTWRGNELIPVLRELGWGQVAHMVRVNDGAEAVGAYLAKSLEGYLTKHVSTGKRLRPVNLSRSPAWYPGGLTAAQRDATADHGERDPGPWSTVVVRKVCLR